MTAATAAFRRVAVPGGRPVALLLVAIGFAIAFVAFAGQGTLPHDNDADVFRRINEFREWVDANRNSNIVLVVVVTSFRTVVGALYAAIFGALQSITWPGLVVLAGTLGLIVGGVRMGLLTAGGIVAFGILGLWTPSLETLALTLASVVVSLAIGIPLGIVCGRSPRFYGAIRPVLDVMQIMPTFAYLAPITLFFLIGPTTAAIVTMIYAVPPAIRITALGIQEVSATTIEAATSLGATSRQLLAKVQLPMARRTIVLGINQTIMMALSMVVITAVVDAPGLGKNIIKALKISDVGIAFDAGFAIVIMAIMLDRLTSRASERMDPGRLPPGPWADRRVRWAALAAFVVAVVAGLTVLGGSTFPKAVTISFAGPINAAVDWIGFNLFFLTDWLKNAITYQLINPIEWVLTSAPWWLVAVALTLVAAIVGGLRPAAITLFSLVAIVGLQMWEHSMQTLTQVLVATALTLVLGLVFGVLSARSDRFSGFLRPILDAAQTMPSFVYLLPAVALFSATRFTGIVAAIIFAVPPVIRLVEIGIRTVPAAVREAATSTGATPGQLLRKVELPLALPSLLVATNQGIILVLSMVVVGGLVGAGALGYDVVAGYVRRDLFGTGLAAAVAIVLVGIMLDRITQGAGTRSRRERPAPGVASGEV